MALRRSGARAEPFNLRSVDLELTAAAQTALHVLLKDVVPAGSARQLAGVYVMLLSGATADARAIGDPSAASRAWHAAEALLNQAKTTVTA